MRLPRQMRQRLAGLAWLGLAAAVCAQTADGDRLLSTAELAAIDQENAMWRHLRPEEDMPANLKLLRAAGYSAAQVAAIEPRLTALWDVPFPRDFGWLREETVRQIQAVDREFIGRTRAVRVAEATGIRLTPKATEKRAAIDREWRQAILHVLNDDEIAEYRLMNSQTAQETGRLIQDLTLTTDERRTLYGWQREFEGTHGRSAPEKPQGDRSRSRRWRMEAQLEQWKRIRELLGDERFVRYLGRASPAYARMKEAIERGAPDVTATSTLDLWWLRQHHALAREQKISSGEKASLLAETRTTAAGLLGEAVFAAYTQDEDARWLQAPAPRVRRKTP